MFARSLTAGSWGSSISMLTSNQCRGGAALPVRSSTSGCLRCVRVTSPRTTSTMPKSSILFTFACATPACSCSFPPMCRARNLLRLCLFFFLLRLVGRARQTVRGGDDRGPGAVPDSLVTEVASNDGYLLQHFQAEVSRCSASSRPRTWPRPPVPAVSPPRSSSWAQRAARSPEPYGRADLVAGNNVFAHVPDIRGFAAGLRALVKDEGMYAGVSAPAAADRAAPVRHDLPRALLLPVPADRVAGVGDGRASGDRRRGLDTHGGSLRVNARPAEGAGEPGPGEGGAGRGGSGGLHSAEGHEGFRRPC